MHPSQVARASGLRSRLGGGQGFKPGDVSYFKTDPGQGWILANAGQTVFGNMFPKFRIDARGLYTVTQSNLLADTNANAYSTALYGALNPVDGQVYFNANAGNGWGTLWRKASGLAEPVFVSNVINPNNWWSNYRFLGFQNGIALFIGYDGSSSGYYNVFYSTNAGFTTWAQTPMASSPSSQLWDVLWTGTRWIVAGTGLWIGSTINNAMTRPTHLGGPANVNSIAWGKLWKIGSVIYAQSASNTYWAKSTDDGLSWTVVNPVNGPYTMGATNSTAWYSQRYGIWLGLNSSNQLLTTTDPTTTWTTISPNIGGYNYGFGAVEMPDPGGIMIAAQSGLWFVYITNGAIETTVFLGNHGVGPNQQANELYLDANNVLFWKGWNTRWQRCYSPIDRCNPPSLGVLGGRTPYMRVSS